MSKLTKLQKTISAHNRSASQARIKAAYHDTCAFYTARNGKSLTKAEKRKIYAVSVKNYKNKR